VENISALGVHIIGDVSALCTPPDDASQEAAAEGSAGPLIPAEAAAQAILGAFVAGGVDRLPVAAPPQPDARTLARALALMGRRRVRRALHVPRPRRAEGSKTGQPESTLSAGRGGHPGLAYSGRAANDQVTVVPADATRPGLTIDDLE
jgi:hypothetical protein